MAEQNSSIKYLLLIWDWRDPEKPIRSIIDDFMKNAMIDGDKLSDIWESVTDLFY